MPTAQPWTARVWAEFRVSNLTRAHRDVLLTLATYRGAGGYCVPAHATLADRVGCSVRTVQRALQQARELGLVEWSERRVRAAWRWLRSSNSYRLTQPADVVRAGLRIVRRVVAPTSGHLGRGGEIQSKKEAFQELMATAAALPDLLAARRAAFAAGTIRARS